MSEVSYVIDALRVALNLGLFGFAALVIALLGYDFRIGHLIFPHKSFYFPAALLLAETALMIDYSVRGKFRHRDKMIRMMQWRGNEKVLDVGTGRGLLLIGAAKHLTTGHAIGTEIWSKKDLSDNRFERTQSNLEAEGITAKCELRNEPAQNMTFKDETFDVILSNQCLHNISDDKERRQPCAEITRVHKPGGKRVLSDFINTAEYVHESSQSRP
jgi:ubiquinone/menaquinone biosynthesis C-methylase UbiE